MSRRIERVNDLLQEQLSELIQREMKDPRLAGLISVTRVETAQDLRNARVYVSVLGSDEEKEAALRALKSAEPFLRRGLRERVTMHHIPALHFRRDESMAEAARVLALMRQVQEERQEKDSPE
ncbi:MAG TPA: 30S ribosome-binding factor RbfA [Dehalococcoidia bacterium]